MGERLKVWVFRTGDAPEYRLALERAVETGNGAVLWDSEPQSGQTDLRVLENSRVCMHWLPYLSGAEHLIARLVGAQLHVPWLEARVQEGDHWDYSFYSVAEHVHSFSTRATYWGNRPCTTKVARAAAARLASEWGLETDTIERYHRACDSPPWRRLRPLRRKGRAYASDTSEYGDIRQLFDFIRALGGEDVTNVVDHATRHAITQVELDQLRSAVGANLCRTS